MLGLAPTSPRVGPVLQYFRERPTPLGEIFQINQKRLFIHFFLQFFPSIFGWLKLFLLLESIFVCIFEDSSFCSQDMVFSTKILKTTHHFVMKNMLQAPGEQCTRLEIPSCYGSSAICYTGGHILRIPEFVNRLKITCFDTKMTL